MSEPISDSDALSITSDLLEALAAHARAAVPRECCGLLLGTKGRVDEIAPTRNVDPDPLRFQVDPGEHIRVNRRIRGTGRSVVGVYHSHPRGGAAPSASDVAEAAYPEFVHVIVSLEHRSSPEVRAYRIVDGSVTPVALHTEPARAGS